MNRMKLIYVWMFPDEASYAQQQTSANSIKTQ